MGTRPVGTKPLSRPASSKLQTVPSAATEKLASCVGRTPDRAHRSLSAERNQQPAVPKDVSLYFPPHQVHPAGTTAGDGVRFTALGESATKVSAGFESVFIAGTLPSFLPLSCANELNPRESIAAEAALRVSYPLLHLQLP